jgi:biopolymer transport protein ExbD
LRVKRRPVEKARIELIPMIDTMAFLLVFFMIASLAMSRQAGLTVDLPQATSAAPQTWGDRALVVTLTEDGRLFLNKDAVQPQALEDQVRARLSEHPNLMVVINADGTLRHAQVIRAMDAVKRAGAAHMAIATKPAEDEGKEQ